MNSCYEELRKFLSKYPKTIAWRVKKHSRIIDEHLNPGEEIVYAFTGQKNDHFYDIMNTYAIVFTNKRIMLATKRLLFGYFFKSVTPDMYNDLTIHRGLFFGSVSIDTIKELIVISNVDVNALDEIETNITETIMKQKRELGMFREKKSS